MKKAFLLISALILLLTGCSKDERSQILATIPAESSYVVLIDLKKINDDLGNKVDSEGKIEPGKAFSQFLNSESRGRDAFLKQAIEGNDFAIDFSFAALFENAGKTMLTFYVTDPEKFTDAVSKADKDVSFSKEGGVLIDNFKNTAIVDNQVWILMSYGEPLTAGEVLKLSKLDDKKSFNSAEYSKKLLECDSEISLYADIIACCDLQGFNGMATKMSVATVFEDPKYLIGTTDFSNGEAKANVKILNEKLKPCKLAVKLDEINVGKLNAFSGKGNSFFALNLNPSSVSKILSQYEPMLKQSMMLDSSVIDALKNLDGTIAASIDNASAGEPSFSAIISFTSPAYAESASQFFRLFGGSFGVASDNNVLHISRGQSEGLPISSVADRFKGTYGGFIMLFQEGQGPDAKLIEQYFKESSLLIRKDGSGIQLDFTMKSKPDQNFLVSLLEYYNSVKR